jgi:hypothetical protein
MEFLTRLAAMHDTVYCRLRREMWNDGEFISYECA